jgi:tricorn protease
MRTLVLGVGLSMILAATGAATSPSDDPQPPPIRPPARLLQNPDVSATEVVFRYANDLWLVPRAGGLATRITTAAGAEYLPRFSPDGGLLAFLANYEGSRELYTMPVAGGAPRRVTYGPFWEVLCDWTPDGRLLFRVNSLGGQTAVRELHTVDSRGGVSEKLPVPYGAEGAISPDGTWLAYTPTNTGYYRTWKRYRGGTATDIWLFNLRDHSSRRVTDWEGTDRAPMWHDGAIYYLSDAGPAHRLNLWHYDLASGERRQVTHFSDFDIRSPAIGPGPGGRGEIVFQHAANLFLLDLVTEQSKAIEVLIPGDHPRVGSELLAVDEFIEDVVISPGGKRVAVEARGDIWTLPVEHGSPRNLTRTSGVGERLPQGSPDGQWIAYFTDATGEYELTIRQSDGKSEPRTLTSGSQTFYTCNAWSPDSKYLAFSDRNGDLKLHSLETGRTSRIDSDPWIFDARTISWSADSRWIAYEKFREVNMDIASIWLYDVEKSQHHRVTSGHFHDHSPTFDRQGDFLYFVSDRDYAPKLTDVEFNLVCEDVGIVVAVPLREDVESPYRPRSDEVTWSEETDDEGEEDSGEKDSGEAAPAVTIDLDGLERRAFRLPINPGKLGNLKVNDKNQLVFSRLSERDAGEVTGVRLFDATDDSAEEQTVTDETAYFELSADGTKLVAVDGSSLSVHDAAPDADGEAVSTDGMNVWIDQRAEWRQLFGDAWRIFRDCFYDPGMHGLDWEGVRDHYAPMLADCATRDDVSLLIREMIAELNVGHADYASGPGGEEEPDVEVGLLAVDFALENGAWRITRIHEGAAWDLDARNPLRQTGARAEEGEYLLAVNGSPVATDRDPLAAFVGLADRTVTVTVSEHPKLDGRARDVIVKPHTLSVERKIRNREWVEVKRRYVDQKTGGRVGYIFLPDYMNRGYAELIAQFQAQRTRQALIIDQRWNGGGYTPDRFLELLNRPIQMYRARHNGVDLSVPIHTHPGPKCLLMNQWSGSSGDMFPWMFRWAGLGKLIGTRTWGGVVGRYGNPSLIDRSRVLVPTSGTYGPDGSWIIEGHGVDPDIEVFDDPSLMVDGGDPQLDAAIKEMLAEIERNGYAPPPRPAGPDRSGMGVPEEER